MKSSIWRLAVLFMILLGQANSNEDAKRLLDDLANGYNSVVRPVDDPKDKIILKLGLKLSQIADIDERNQIMTTNVWVRHEWYDHKLKWNPLHYGNITKVNIPSTNIWLADVVLYNNADGDYQITTKTKATVYYDGKIIWEPPMIYKSYCAINIEYYPFDIQDCYMKFGTWSFNGELIVMEHINKNHSIPEISETEIKKDGASYKLYSVEMGIDMSDYYDSVEWDILSIPAQKNIKYYECCPEPYYDIYFNITIRRKTLFYTVNLIIPCVNISFLSVLVFYLPSDSGEKLTLGISILVALLVFYLLLIELIPPTSLVIPLLGKYLLFTLILVNLSILLTIFILNLHHRKPNTHKMPFWMKRVFIDILPKMLMIERPKVDELNLKGDKTRMPNSNMASPSNAMKSMLSSPSYSSMYSLINDKKPSTKQAQATSSSSQMNKKAVSFMKSGNNGPSSNYGHVLSTSSNTSLNNESMSTSKNKLNDFSEPDYDKSNSFYGRSNENERLLPRMNAYSNKKPVSKYYPKTISDALDGIRYINTQMKKDNDEREEIDDWKYASMVIDRLLLWIFTSACLMGTFGILLQAPSIYDERKALGRMNRTI